MSNYYNGYDLSSIQGTNFSWQQVVKNNISFIIHRCGIGNSGIDGDCVKNIAAAKAVGLKTGVYHFIYPLPPLASQPLRDPVAQANYHFNAAQGELAFIDCEWPTPQTFSQWGCSPTQIGQWMAAYFAEYERLDGRKPYLYTYPSWGQVVNLNSSFTQYPLWIASYTTTPVIPKPWTDWALWQTGGGNLAKLSNGVPVDTNVCKDLSIFDATPNVAQPTPTPATRRSRSIRARQQHPRSNKASTATRKPATPTSASRTRTPISEPAPR